MVNNYDRLQFMSYLERVFKESTHKSNSNCSFHCPFCNHYKQKLSINLDTQVWHCWVCNESGKGMYKIFNKLNSNQAVKEEYNQRYKLGKSIPLTEEWSSFRDEFLAKMEQASYDYYKWRNKQ